MRRRFLFAVWTVAASLILLEIVLQVGSLFFKATPSDLGADVDMESVRILALGDSWVEGAEAPEGEGFVDHLGRELGTVAGDAPIQMFNLGRTGANSAHVAITAMDEIPRVQPALIVVLVGQNNASNFYRVAEVEERLGQGSGKTRLADRSRVVKLVRIAWANARGGSGYGATPTIEVPTLEYDDDGQPIFTAPLLATPAGEGYLKRELWSPPAPTGSKLRDLAWRVLYLTAQRDLDEASALAMTLGTELSWPTAATTPSAPLAATETELLARYALMRLAREQHRWRAVRYHAGAAIGYEPRGALSDLASAEAHLLAGDWRTARTLLTSAHNRAPGFMDTIDLAARFPEQARDPDVFEALEYAPAAEDLPAHEQALVVRYAQFDPESAVGPYSEWVTQHPDDLALRVDLAVWWIEHGRHTEADALMGVQADPATGMLPPPTSTDADIWRFAVARALSTGDRDHALYTVALGLDATSSHEYAPLLGEMAEVASAHVSCDLLGALADQWFTARGDANGYARLVAPCMEPSAAAQRLRGRRATWGPLGGDEAWRALVRAGRKPFELLYRDLDLVVAEAEKVRADVLVVNYPNPSEDHTALRDILAEYVSTRPVGYVDLWARFDQKFTREEWAERLGPNGHCNATGYREMADGILEWVGSEQILAAAPPAQ